MANETKPTDGNGVGGRKPSGRLPKYRRAQEAFGKMEITERDERILELIYTYRYIQARQIMAVLGGSERQIARRLQGLYHHELVTRIVPQVRMVVLDRKVHDNVTDDEEGRRVPFSGSPKMTYVLDQAGAKYLAERVYGCPMKELGWRAQHKRRTEWFVEHHVAISEFHAALELACRQRSDLELVDWAQDAEAHGECTWKLPRWREEETFRVNPDAYFAVQKNGEKANLFLEIDRGSEESSRIHSKLEAYGWYLAHPSFLKKYARPEDVRVLIVTTSPARMAHMMTTVEQLMNGQDYKGRPYRKVPGLAPGRVWFTTADEYNVSEPERLFTSIWRTVKAPNKTVSLFG